MIFSRWDFYQSGVKEDLKKKFSEFLTMRIDLSISYLLLREEQSRKSPARTGVWVHSSLLLFPALFPLPSLDATVWPRLSEASPLTSWHTVLWNYPNQANRQALPIYFLFKTGSRRSKKNSEEVEITIDLWTHRAPAHPLFPLKGRVNHRGKLNGGQKVD